VKQALVTGAHGFIGRHVARALAASGYEVKGLGHGAWVRDDWRAWGMTEWHTADVTSESLTTYAGEPELIVHCAGSGSVAFSRAEPYQDFQRTVTTTLSVLEFVRLRAPAARLVLPSSGAVYGDARVVPIRIDAPLSPVSPYGVHKKLAEDLCRSYSRHFGLRTAIVRLFSVYGSGLRKQILWDACRRLIKGEVGFSGTGFETRDWIHVEDAASLLIRVADFASPDSVVVNGGAGQGVLVREVLSEVATALGIDEPLRFSGIVRPGDPAHTTADISQALECGWTPRADLREQIRVYVSWFMEEGR
jgi:UDP-glucose 4-epimerase